jgi:hypothetical protein
MRGIRFLRPHTATAMNWWNAGGCPDAAWADVWTAKGAASYAASKVGNVNSTTMAEIGGALGWGTATGWQSTAGRALNTTIVPQNNHSIIIGCTALVATTNCWIAGAIDGVAGENIMFVQSSGGLRYDYGTDVTNFAGTVVGSAVLAMTKQNAYRNGAIDLALSDAVTNAFSRPLYLCAVNNNGATQTHIVGWYIYAAGLAVTDISAYVPALSAAMAAL